MSRIVTLPRVDARRADGLLAGGWWHDDPGGDRIICDLCPRACSLKAGDRGFCFVRQNIDGEMVLTTYGRSTGFCIDPIEKKPLNHFHPGSSVLSFGTAGCNLGCKFCQNWDISKSREVERLSAVATPEAIAEAARRHVCTSVAFTYNDPVIWAEYAIETARACHAAGIKTVAVTAGYITPTARGAFFEVMDAANVDLKGFTEAFYHKITYSHLQPVLETLRWLKHETDVWFEITNLVIPEVNDSMDEIAAMCRWILEHCGDDVPVHFTAFHPDFRMRDRPNTPPETLLQAHEAARREGLKFVYVGNVDDVKHQSTYCPHCQALLIERNWYELGAYNLVGDRCGQCGGVIPGRFGARPGTWGRRRLPIEISRPTRAPDVDVNVIPMSALMKPIPAPARRDAPAPELTPEQCRGILTAAAELVTSGVLGRTTQLSDPTLVGASEVEVLGAYVTLKRRGHLRACCGILGEPRPLREALGRAALSTATEDHRLPPISPTELPYLHLSVNLLYGMAPITARGRDRIEAVEVGRHGLRIHRGSAVGLLLPSVAVEGRSDAEGFLRQVCRKAGLPTTAWEDDETHLFTFESVEFGGPFEASVLGADVAPGDRLAPAELQALASHASDTILALARGLTPNYYLPGVPDGNITGLAITLPWPGQNEPAHFVQMSMRPGLPLQATLFGLSEHAARVVDRAEIASGVVRVGVTVLSDPAMHGNARVPDLRGLNPSHRALVMIEHDKTAWVFDPAASPDDLLAAARSQFPVRNPDAAGLFSLAAQSTEPKVVFRSVPRPVPASGTRPPDVAGRFYPGDPVELARLADSLLAASERQAEPWKAVMVPHAGLSYSGQLAAAVFNRVKIPDLVIVLGPKHTRLGVDWAVSPHDAWSIPGATIAADPELARALADAIPGLQLDSAAHLQEHAIEVELPLLARLAPRARVVGLAIGGGDWEQCQGFAHALAEVVRRLPSPPLLVISSDMNHFATDSENRRLDEIALQAMERLDPAHLLATVSEHGISMCGVLPAVIVMEALRALGRLKTSQRVGYATSADVNGDTSRVVGYAGILLE